MRKFYCAICSVSLLIAVGIAGFQATPAQATEALTVDSVLAVDADPDYGEYLASECMTCHTRQAGSIPKINGKEPAFIASALLEYKDKTRANETMRSIANAMGKEEIAALAAYFAALAE